LWGYPSSTSFVESCPRIGAERAVVGSLTDADAHARAAFSGTVVAANENLERRPKLLNDDAFGQGWMLIVRAAEDGWRNCLITGPSVAAAFAAWIAAESYKGRSG
jgi:glycine cleavage system H lipoate-binding protein